MQRAFHQYECAHDLVKAMDERRIFRMFHIYMVMCGFEYASSKLTKKYNLWHKIYRRKIFEFGLYNEVVDVWHILIEWKILFDILCIEMAWMKLCLAVLNDLVGMGF